MTRILIEQIASDAQVAAARALILELFDYALSIDPLAKSAHAFEGLEEQLAALPGVFGPPEGAFLLASVEGAPAGCVGSHKLEDGVCELKRMYVRPAYRGLQLGDALTRRLIETARAQGYSKMVLDSFHTMKQAHRVYANLGFSFCEPRVELAPEYRGKVVFMELVL